MQSEPISWIKSLTRTIQLACKYSRLEADVTCEGNKIEIRSELAGIQLRIFGTSNEPQFQVIAVPLREGRQLIQNNLIHTEITKIVGECGGALPADSQAIQHAIHSTPDQWQT